MEKPKYLFLSNSTKPNKEQYESKELYRISSFEKVSVETAEEMGYEVYVGINRKFASKLKCDHPKIHLRNVEIYRNPFQVVEMIKAYKHIMDILKEGGFEAIHCNTPIGGVLGRICGKKAGINKIIYTAHGFHFYKGAPIFNWIVYYPIERWMAHFTDVLITINQEDYQLAQKFHLKKGGKVYYVPGVGIETSRYISDKIRRKNKRKELGLKEDEIAVVSVGDLVKSKNYPVSIEVIRRTNNPKLHYYICGRGPEENILKEYSIKLGIENQVHFLGFRTDIKEILNAFDIFLSTTKQEGLSRSLLEAMVSGLPCVVSNNRINIDLLNESQGGFICRNVNDYVIAINTLYENTELRWKMQIRNQAVIKKFGIETAKKSSLEIYESEITREKNKLIGFMSLRTRKRIEIGIPLDAKLLISVGELNINKNNKVIISALGKISDNSIHYILCGIGECESQLRELAEELHIEDKVHFLGYRTDIKELLEASDIFIMPSIREGLSRSLMEAMASGLPCIASNIRGNRDLIHNNKGGYLCELSDCDSFASGISQLILKEKKFYDEMCNYNLEVIKDYDINIVKNKIYEIYKNTFLNLC